MELKREDNLPELARTITLSDALILMLINCWSEDIAKLYWSKQVIVSIHVNMCLGLLEKFLPLTLFKHPIITFIFSFIS